MKPVTLMMTALLITLGLAESVKAASSTTANAAEATDAVLRTESIDFQNQTQTVSQRQWEREREQEAQRERERQQEMERELQRRRAEEAQRDRDEEARQREWERLQEARREQEREEEAQQWEWERQQEARREWEEEREEARREWEEDRDREAHYDWGWDRESLRWRWDNWRQSFPSSVYSSTRVEFVAESNDWVTVLIEGLEGDRVLRFTGGSDRQIVYLPPGAYRLRFQPTFGGSIWQSGYLNVGRTSAIRIFFDQDERYIQVEDDPYAWTPESFSPWAPGAYSPLRIQIDR